MINTKRLNTNDYTQVGFIEAKDIQGNYQNIDHIYDNQENIVFQQGYLNEYQGANDFGIPAIGKPLIDYRIYGNTSQTGTPLPQNPIMPQGTGERTGNLLHEFYAASGEISGNSYTITKNSIETHNDGSVLGAYYVLAEFKRYGNYANYTPIDEEHSFEIPAGTYTFSGNENIYNRNNGLRLIVGQLGQAVSGTSAGAINVGVGQTFTVDADSYVCPVLEIRYDSHVDEYILTNPMLNAGSTPLPYEPYGYKIPISSASTTTPVYLGEVQTTRKIKKLVLTGGNDENWNKSTSGYNGYYMYMDINHNYSEPKIPNSPIFCNIAVMGTATEYRTKPWILQSDASLAISTDPVIVGGTDIDAWKSYLAQQYANGTPVTVWYVLANEETAVVNEPLMKIGDYADTLSMEQAGIEIPTLKKPNTTVIDVDTEVEPSEVDVTYRGSTKLKYDLFLASNGDSFEAKDGQSLYIGGDL